MKYNVIVSLFSFQLDANELDNEVVSLTKSQISQLFKYHGVSPVFMN